MTCRRSRWRRTLTGLVAIVAAVATSTAHATPTDPADRQVDHPLRALSGPDARIVDDRGRTAILRGINVNGLGEYYREWPDLPATETLTEDDFAGIAALGANVVRLIISWSSLEPTRGVIDEAYLDRIEQAVTWARAHDIYVLLDMHQDAWGPAVHTPDDITCPPLTEPAVGWDGAPAWATALVGTAATCRIGKRELSVAVQTSFQNFYLDIDGIQTELVRTWAAVAARFADDPTVVGYDLLNEPNPGLLPGINDYLLLGDYYRRAIRAIRDAEQTTPGGFGHIVFFEPSVITGPLPLPGPQPLFAGDSGSAEDDNMVYAPHQYNESISPLPGSLAQGFADTATAADHYGTTFFNGEWGFWDSDPAMAAEKARRFAALEDAHLVGGTYWQWRQACGDPHNIGTRGTRPDCAAQDTGIGDDPATTAVLDRSYPRASPGRLTAIDSEIATGALSVTGTADRADATAELWIPARCADPRVTGRNIADAHRRAVPGGWRIAVDTVAAGDYRIRVDC
ncbi:cellulase family glycosylhydrolase [Nocardia uniformis]|uniref:Cellulase family glycosylhydrolase n=1 Tax=Nocardia uniformis TaxID=53432 RepID=A0A849C4K6_9NOCA|nr:cellulase family glycosylhydrolase [Nocardia uniformis]NNH73643.1 cellulase family glycosylhydrolase [Nocardia uniformis]